MLLPVLDEVTEDRLLGGRVRLRQPARGYRVAIDPVLLAAAVPAKVGDRVLDAGAGTGAASLCLAARVSGCRIIGLENQPALCQLASDNAAQNRLDRQIEMMPGDLGGPPLGLASEGFDHVMTNPPYLKGPAASASPVRDRQLASLEHGLDLAGWLGACRRLLAPGGFLTMIQRADRLGEVLAAVDDRLGELIVFPLWPGGRDRPAKRILLQGRKGSRGPLVLAPGLILHEEDGRFSAAAEAILRHGEALNLRGPAHG